MSTDGAPDSPYQLLAATERAVRAQLRTSLPQAPIQDDWLGLAFLSGEQVLLTPLNEVLIILPVTTFAYIPGVKNWLLGLATYRDDIFPVTDLAGFLGQKMSPFTKHTRLLVIESQGEKAGLVVTRVIGLQRLSREQRQYKRKMTLDAIYEPFVMGSWEDATMTLPIISCQAIMNHPKFRDVLAKTEVMNDLH